MQLLDTGSLTHGIQLTRADDLLWRHLKSVPAFRALLRAVEARFFTAIPLANPVLDLGCGDGHFAEMVLAGYELYGVDPWWGPLSKASSAATYRLVLQSMGDSLPFPTDSFATVVSNSVLEHIQGVQEVLFEASRVLQHDGLLVFTVPSHLFSTWLGVASFLERLGLHLVADGYRKVFNRISRHAHTDSPEVWAARLAKAGFQIERWQYYFSKKALHALELGHVQGLPSAILHFLTGHWIVAPWKDSLRRTERWVRPFYEESPGEQGAYVLILARKRSATSIECVLPAAQPLSEDEIHRPGSARVPDAVPTSQPSQPRMGVPESSLSPEQAARRLTAGEAEVLVGNEDDEPAQRLSRFPYLSAGLILLSLFFAAMGQLILSNQPQEPAAGIRWYLYGIGALLLLLWEQRSAGASRLPKWSFSQLASMRSRRWLYLLGLVLSMGAYGVASGGVGPRAGWAIVVWLLSAAVAFYALDVPTKFTFPKATRIGLVSSLSLFLFALALRTVNLSEHPYIINGIEASIGLEAIRAVGSWQINPFATGWLTNPTLPLYLIGIPLKLLGPSALSVRLLSPIVGALTVMLTMNIGSRLYGREVGLAAAIMLAGSHYHTHYSRLGMTNIWDPLVVLAAIGAVSIAWRAPSETSRRRWIAAGIVVGLSAYFFTSSRLLPLIVGGLSLCAFAFRRDSFLRQWRDMLAGLLLAFVVALPLILHYIGNPTVFMERANSLGVLGQQSGWLVREAAATGADELTLLGRQLWQAALAFNFLQDSSSAYHPLVPLLGYGPAILFVFGVILAARRIRQLRYAMLLVWLATTIIFAGALLIELPSSHRLVIATPVLFLLAGVAMAEIGGILVALFRNGRQVAPHVRVAPNSVMTLVATISLIFAMSDALFYFGRYQTQHTFGDRNTEIANRIADYLNSLDDRWTVYFHGPPSMYVDFPTIPFLAPDFVRGQNIFDVMEPSAQLPVSRTPAESHIFLPERAAEIESIQTTIPGGRLMEYPGYYSDPSFYVYEVEQ